mmetsp:Transcript_13559/g.24027  ORF Transcript_13559/g.24027 Transcript_13559/m.24027 type:complete len:489 (+) Transcript_13559:41-1507(+)
MIRLILLLGFYFLPLLVSLTPALSDFHGDESETGLDQALGNVGGDMEQLENPLDCIGKVDLNNRANNHFPTHTEKHVVVIDYEDLLDGSNLLAQIEESFGPDGLGIIAVVNVPDFKAQRIELLPLAKRFADLADKVKEEFEHEESSFSVGWSHGRERLAGTGEPDSAKGSFYANPLHDAPWGSGAAMAPAARDWPEFAAPNLWPRAHLPELEGAFTSLGRTVVGAGALLAAQCDRYIEEKLGTKHFCSLLKIVEESRCPKGRLLHYFPFENKSHPAGAEDILGASKLWCGWHNDHGALTGLVPAMYLDDQTGEPVEYDDPGTGLFICNRKGEVIKPVVPHGSLLFQIGETAQILSGGHLQATPHCVRFGPAGSTGNPHKGHQHYHAVCRESFAVFMEPEWDFLMHPPAGISEAEVLASSLLEGEMPESTASSKEEEKAIPPQGASFGTTNASGRLPPGVVRGTGRLGARWHPGASFGEFTTRTYAAFY